MKDKIVEKTFKPKLVKKLKFKYDNVVICYARNGHLLYGGRIENIPKHILDYYCGLMINNKVLKRTYIEVTEDNKWWDD